MVDNVSEEEFDRLVVDAIDELPAWIQEVIERENIVICSKEEAPPEVQAKRQGQVLGLFTGVPYGARSSVPLPARIELYRGPLLDNYDSKQLKGAVKKTLIHEVAHFVGMDEQQVRRLGY